jgi:beta-ribofuranosylaminobenzene 5'-phosphate synthase
MRTENLVMSSSAKMASVKAHARLHMGFFDMHGGLGRKFGSLGVSLASPVTEITASLSDRLMITGAVGKDEMIPIENAIKHFQNELKVSTSLNIHVKQLIPSHFGLGSGTQIKLTLLAVIDRLNQLKLDHNDFVKASGRGMRSGIGLGTFWQGGVVVDAGRSANTVVPPIISRVEFPENWQILLIFDCDNQGVHGEKELEAFKNLPAFSESLASKLCRHVLMQALPALKEHDLNAFGEAVRALQLATGEHFAAAQGGLYASKKVAQVLNWFENEGIACFGQSSWGPTGFAIFENKQVAEMYLAQAEKHFADKALSFMLTQGCNTGASIEVA